MFREDGLHSANNSYDGSLQGEAGGGSSSKDLMAVEGYPEFE